MASLLILKRFLSHVVTHTPTQFFKTTKTTSLKNSTNRNHLPIIE